MNSSPEELASLYVLGQLDHCDRAAFEAQLACDSTLAALVGKVEAAIDIQRSLLGFAPSLNKSTP